MLGVFPFRVFHDLAVQLINECYQQNETLTLYLMEKKLEIWKGQTCFSIAVESQNPDFIAHSACNNIVLQKWNCDLNIPQTVSDIFFSVLNLHVINICIILTKKVVYKS